MFKLDLEKAEELELKLPPPGLFDRDGLDCLRFFLQGFDLEFFRGALDDHFLGRPCGNPLVPARIAAVVFAVVGEDRSGYLAAIQRADAGPLALTVCVMV